MAFHMNFNLDFPGLMGELGGRRSGNPFELLNHVFRHDFENLKANETEVVETEDGYLISAHVPGVAAEHVKAVVEQGNDGISRLTITVEDTDEKKSRKIGQHSKETLLVDVTSARASCIDGILRVAVPKVAPSEKAIPVFPESPFPESGESNTPEDVQIGGEQLHVPGYAAGDIKIIQRLPQRDIIVEGDNKPMGHFKATLKLPGGVHSADNISAWCQNGILNFRFEIRKGEHGPVQISVSNDHIDVDDANRITVLEHGVPGMAAGDINVQVDREGKVVKATGKTSGNKCHCLFVIRSLPSGVSPNTVKASCVDGLLKVTASKPEPPVEHHIEVSATELACIGGAPSQQCE